MRFDKNGKMHTLEQDIQEVWASHGLEVIEELVPAHPNNPVTTWIIKAQASPTDSCKYAKNSGRTERGKEL